MEVIPAIDIRGGRVVRLLRGDYSKETPFPHDPVELARRWADHGAPRIHLVDLDGAREGRPVNLDVLRRLAGAVDVPLQVGGGVRTLEDALTLRDAGADRIVVGTVAVSHPDLLGRLVESLSAEAVVVAVDSREGRVAVQGWERQTPLTAEEVARRALSAGAYRVLFTDITRDGTLSHPNFDSIARMASIPGLRVLASGGVSSLDDLRRLASIGVEGAVVGSALLRGLFTLSQALDAVRDVDPDRRGAPH